MATLTHDRTARNLGGIGLSVVSAVSFALSGPVARGLLDAGWTPAAAVAVRVLIGGLALVPLAVVALRGRWVQLRRSAPIVLLYGLGPVAGTQFAYFTSIQYLPVGVALLIEFTSPVAVVVWMWLRHTQRPAGLTVLGALLGMTGLVLVLDLGAAAISWIGIGWALLAMLGGATYFVLSARVDDALPGVVLAAGALLVGGVALLITGATGLLPFAVTAAEVSLGGVRDVLVGPRRSSSGSSPLRCPTPPASARQGDSVLAWRRSAACWKWWPPSCWPGCCWPRCHARSSWWAGCSSSPASLRSSWASARSRRVPRARRPSPSTRAPAGRRR